MHIPNGVVFRLRSGNIDEEVEMDTVLRNDHENGTTTEYGGYYDGSWYGGLGVMMLNNHIFDPVVNECNIEVSVTFGLPAPEPFWRQN